MNHIFLVGLAAVAVLAGAFAISKTSARLLGWRAVTVGVVALVWGFLRATAFNSVHWTFVRPLNGGWIVLFVLLLAAAVAAAIFLPVAAMPIAWFSLFLAIVLPVNDIASAQFWGDWMQESTWVKGAMLLALVVIFVFMPYRGISYAVAAMGFLMIAAWGLQASGLPIETFTGAPTPTVTTSASPAPSAGATPTATPAAPATSATPSSSSTTTSATPAPSARTVFGESGRVIGWDDALFDVEEANATSEWQKLIDDNQSKLGFAWKEAQTWATTKTADGKILGARKVVVFGASASEISDTKARELAGVAGAAKPLDVTRAAACYQDLVMGAQVCPAGDARAVLFIAPIGTAPDGTLLLKDGSGVGVVLDPSANGKVRLAPATYTVDP